MLEITSPEERRKAAQAILAKQKSLFSIAVSVGECKKCPLKDSCPYVNETDTTCRAADVAIKQFETQAAKSPWIGPEDALGIRTLAAQYASIIIAEMYFAKYGSVVVKEVNGARQMAFSMLHDQYTKLLKNFHEALDRYGLTPMGRKNLKPTDSGGGRKGSFLESYIDAQYAVKGDEKKEAPDPLPPDGTFYQPTFDPEAEKEE